MYGSMVLHGGWDPVANDATSPTHPHPAQKGCITGKGHPSAGSKGLALVLEALCNTSASDTLVNTHAGGLWIWPLSIW